MFYLINIEWNITDTPSCQKLSAKFIQSLNISGKQRERLLCAYFIYSIYAILAKW